MTEPLHLALDIGTRSMVALLFQPRNGGIIVKRVVVREHPLPLRVMRDGQVEDVSAVAEGIQSLLADLRKDLSEELPTSITMAVAGRSLTTAHGLAEKVSEEPFCVEGEIYGRLASEALFNAAMNLEESSRHHSVGHVVTAERRNGEEVLRLLGQTAKSAEVEVLATFLREEVVEGKLSAVKQAGLSVESITLEPVAVLNLLSQPGQNGLVIALIDIGAGTTDLAVSSPRGAGRAIDFRMIPLAGDEVTESLARKFLLPFEEAERIKRLAGQVDEDTVTATDLSGRSRRIRVKEVLRVCAESVRALAEAVSLRLAEMEARRPDAVFLVGGGSLLPGLPEALAERLGLLPDHVFRREARMLPNVVDETGLLEGPEMVTPVAIALSHGKGHRPAEFSVQGRKVRHLIRAEGCVAAELIPRAGLDREDLVGRGGTDLAITLEGQKEVLILPGEPGGLPRVTIDGREADLSTLVTGGEEIQFARGADGRSARKNARDMIEYTKTVRLVENGIEFEAAPLLFRREKGGLKKETVLRPEDSLRDGDHLRFDEAVTPRALLVWRGRDVFNPLREVGRVRVDGEEQPLPERQLTVRINGRPAGLDDPLQEGDQVQIGLETPVYVRDVVSLPHPGTAVHIRMNGREEKILDGERAVWRAGERLSLDDVVADGDEIITPAGRRRRLKLADVLSSGLQVPSPRRGERLVMEIDGRAASWDSPLDEGIRIDMKVEEIA